jgi:hypothetical protein
MLRGSGRSAPRCHMPDPWPRGVPLLLRLPLRASAPRRSPSGPSLWPLPPRVRATSRTRLRPPGGRPRSHRRRPAHHRHHVSRPSRARQRRVSHRPGSYRRSRTSERGSHLRLTRLAGHRVNRGRRAQPIRRWRQDSALVLGSPTDPAETVEFRSEARHMASRRARLQVDRRAPSPMTPSRRGRRRLEPRAVVARRSCR